MLIKKEKEHYENLSIDEPSFRPSTFLTCYAILQTQFEAMTSRTAFIDGL